MNNNTMSTDEVITLINNRIHELKYQQIGLKSFIVLIKNGTSRSNLPLKN